MRESVCERERVSVCACMRVCKRDSVCVCGCICVHEWVPGAVEGEHEINIFHPSIHFQFLTLYQLTLHMIECVGEACTPTQDLA